MKYLVLVILAVQMLTVTTLASAEYCNDSDDCGGAPCNGGTCQKN